MEKITCPYCGSKIDGGVIKCRYCGEFLDNKHKTPTTITYVGSFELTPKIYCTNCKYEGKAGSSKKGSTIIEIVLWIYLIPGLIYHLWRGKSFYRCPKCKNQYINKVL